MNYLRVFNALETQSVRTGVYQRMLRDPYIYASSSVGCYWCLAFAHTLGGGMVVCVHMCVCMGGQWDLDFPRACMWGQLLQLLANCCSSRHKLSPFPSPLPSSLPSPHPYHPTYPFPPPQSLSPPLSIPF